MTVELSALLHDVEGQDVEADYHDVAAVFEGALREIGDHDHPDKEKIRSEYIAFSFTEQLIEPADRSTHFGPQFSYTTNEGSAGEFPPLTAVTEGVVAYWTDRAQTTRNDVLRARYADLVWDLSRPATGRRPNIRLAHAAIDASLECVRGNKFKEGLCTIIRIKRALDLSISIKDKIRTEVAAVELVALEDRIGVDHQPGLWGFAFDALVDTSGRDIDDRLKSKVIADLETRFERLSAVSPPDPSALEAAMERLTRLYSRQNQVEEEVRVLRKYVAVVEAYAKIVSPLVGSGWLDRVHELLSNRGLKEDAARVALLMREVELRSTTDVKEYSTRIAIPIAELDAQVAVLLDADREQVYTNVAATFIMDRTAVEQQVLDIAKKAVLLSLFKISIRDNEGRAVASVGSVEDDLDGRVAFQMSQNLQVGAPVLRYTLEKVAEKHTLTADSVRDYLAKSPAFLPERLPIIWRGLQALFLSDSYVAACVLVPEIEAGLRRILHLVGGNVYKRSRTGGTNLRNMDEILRDEAVIATLTERVTFCLRIVFTDARGWNLRNNICHGLLRPASLGQPAADRILHALLLLGTLRTVDNKDASPGEEGA
ncbi:MAG: DUF4209 domain-containing protein [Myxococcales bacterium]|nr:DUF4209 domain-containing protein [Myxococcales bacterium]